MFLKVCKEVLVAGGLTDTLIISSCSYFENRKYWGFFLDTLSQTQDIRVPQGRIRKHRRDSHFSGGVIVMVWAVNSSSKYLVSVSDVTWGLKGGTSWDTEETSDQCSTCAAETTTTTVLGHGVDGQTCRRVFRRPRVWQKHRAAWFCPLCVGVADVPEKSKCKGSGLNACKEKKKD